MIWEVTQAKNGEDTLLLNNFSIYSKYRPFTDAKQWMLNEYNPSYLNYFLIGLGLGYHLKALAEIEKEKPIFVYFFEEKELELFKQTNGKETWWHQSNIQIIHEVEGYPISDKSQIMIPNVWIKAIGQKHPLFGYLEDIKINQVTYKNSAELMRNNFEKNILLQDISSYPKYLRKVACLVASGPSLNETIDWLREIKDEMVIISVGSSLKMLLANGINPDAVVISDPKPDIKIQLQDTDYKGILFYLSTSNHETVKNYNGKRYILMQEGYFEAENFSKQYNIPLLETGGSVSTVALSLIEQLGFESVILFGQDLGFVENSTHASLSTSGRHVVSNITIRSIIANDGSLINTTPNLHTYLRWFENKAQRTKLKMYNTAKKGAAISNVPFIDKTVFNSIRNKLKNL